MKQGSRDWEYKYSEEERQAIIDAAPAPLPANVDIQAEIRNLEDSAGIYLGVGQTYRDRFKGKAPAWKKASKNLEELFVLAENGLVELHVMLPQLMEARDRARVTAVGADMSAHAHRSNRSPETRQLYDQGCATYVKLGGKLSRSRPKGGDRGEPYGPAIRFLKAVLSPVMGEYTPGAERLEEIISERR